MNNAVTFPKTLKALRESKGITQIEMAEKLNITQGFYAKLESGMHHPADETILDLVKILKPENKKTFIKQAVLARIPSMWLSYFND